MRCCDDTLWLHSFLDLSIYSYHCNCSDIWCDRLFPLQNIFLSIFLSKNQYLLLFDIMLFEIHFVTWNFELKSQSFYIDLRYVNRIIHILHKIFFIVLIIKYNARNRFNCLEIQLCSVYDIKLCYRNFKALNKMFLYHIDY